MQKTKNISEVYIIEKIIRKNKNKYLFKWKSYSSDFNTWIVNRELVNNEKKIFDMTKNFTTPEIFNKYRHTDKNVDKKLKRKK